ncbi:HPr family phosphocarrier protein [Kordiimonas marina]|uniref:HPr family phosphocarrier protein n=1 Tax=Kordiimonas marina TaxID=2872312 RepID=UPI001FF10478|nr:HPr family phosphocarrier protein [Kordiimonas marina]MCJ9428309.1 HPr family phosphocarrier protein [Kordiimonas marina]
MSDSSFSRDVTIVNTRGLHARASARFAREAGTFDAIVHVAKDGTQVVGTSIMGLMMLGAAKGETIIISTEGPAAGDALDALCALVSDRFGEED